jgi:hypothetical protein
MLLSHSAVALGNIIYHSSLIKDDRPGWTNLGALYKGRKTGDDFIWVMDDRRLVIGNRGSNVYYSAISPGNIIHHLSLITHQLCYAEYAPTRYAHLRAKPPNAKALHIEGGTGGLRNPAQE